MDVRVALETFGVAEGIPVIMSEAVGGVFSGAFSDMPAAEFLDRLATVHNLVWYYDGASIYVNGSGETTSMLQDLRYMKVDEVRSLLRELGVEDERFPIKTAQSGELILVSGPPRYVQLVAETISRADRLRESRTFNEVEVRLFPLVHTWADNTSFSVSTPESSVTIKGVAYLLDEIMATTAENVRDGTGTNTVEGADLLGEKMAGSFHPVIRPENRLNAVMIRDVATRMPMYERLIRQLDRPQQLVEIGVTVVEMSKKDALDWQLSLSVSGGKNEHFGSAGMNAENLSDPLELVGKGLSGAYSYIGKDISVSASLSALKQKGKVRHLARTSVLTMNNLAASLSDTRTFQARVVGEKVANVESISAGTTLRVKPRIVEPPEGATGAVRRVWMTMELQDGGFDSVTVDGMPMKSSTVLQTQAAVLEHDSLLLAGYFRDIEEDGGWGIPYLRDIPFIGWLFGGASVVNETVQRLFILTPHVVEIGDPDDVSFRAVRQRDMTSVDCLEDDIEGHDAERRLRRLEAEDHRERRRQLADERYDRRKAEIDHEREIRDIEHEQVEDQLKADRRVWKADVEARREAAEKTSEERREAAEKAVEAVEKASEERREAAEKAAEAANGEVSAP